MRRAGCTRAHVRIRMHASVSMQARASTYPVLRTFSTHPCPHCDGLVSPGRGEMERFGLMQALCECAHLLLWVATRGSRYRQHEVRVLQRSTVRWPEQGGGVVPPSGRLGLLIERAPHARPSQQAAQNGVGPRCMGMGMRAYVRACVRACIHPCVRACACKEASSNACSARAPQCRCHARAGVLGALSREPPRGEGTRRLPPLLGLAPECASPPISPILLPFHASWGEVVDARSACRVLGAWHLHSRPPASRPTRSSSKHKHRDRDRDRDRDRGRERSRDRCAGRGQAFGEGPVCLQLGM